MIELASNWKRGLTLGNPILLAAGGCSIESTCIGGIVTLPITARPRAGAPPPRIVEIPGGVLMRTGAANPGLAQILREHWRDWEQGKIPIIVAFASQGVNDWATMAEQLENIAGVGGIELQMNPVLDAVEAIRAVRASTDLPILVKLDLDHARDIAADCVAAGANTLVIGRAPRGMKMIEGKPWFGRLYGPAAKPFALKTLAEIAELKLAAPIIACGGAHSADDAREYLAAGACAVEIDSAEWIEPGIAARIAMEINRMRIDADERG
jgi:dihydroorotate dehydrogenase (NAD+) catalytic subunit